MFLNIYKSTTYGFIQLTRNEIGQRLSAYNEGSAPYEQVNWRFPDEINNYSNSRQNKYEGINLDLDNLNRVYLLILMLSLFWMIFLLVSPLRTRLEPVTTTLLIFVTIAIVANAFITAGLNSPYGRLQTRVVWLLPMALMMVTSANRGKILEYIRDHFRTPKS